MQAHVSQYKKDMVTKVSKEIAAHRVIGILNMENLGAGQLARLRRGLRKDATMFMTKRRLLERAIEQNADKHKGIEKLKSYLIGMPALMYSNEDPFKIARTIKKSKSQAPIKAGQIAPYDLIIQAGPTPFAPGPIISELAAVGIKAGIEGGKVAVKMDATIAKQGDKVTQKQAEVLAKFSVMPMEIGLDLVAVYDNGIIFERAVLEVDEKVYINRVAQASLDAIALAVEIGYPAKETINRLIAKAFKSARAVSIESAFVTKDTVSDIITKAEKQANALLSKTQS